MEDGLGFDAAFLREQEEEHDAIVALAAVMFPERTAWGFDVAYEAMVRENYGEVNFFTFSQDAACTACETEYRRYVPISRAAMADGAKVRELLATFGASVWTDQARDHARTCRERHVWDAIIADDPALSRFFAHSERARLEMAKESRRKRLRRVPVPVLVVH